MSTYVDLVTKRTELKRYLSVMSYEQSDIPLNSFLYTFQTVMMAEILFKHKYSENNEYLLSRQ